MKRPLILLMIIPWLLTGFPSCSGTFQAVTRNPDGSTTTVPILSPEDAAFHESRQTCLNSKF